MPKLYEQLVSNLVDFSVSDVLNRFGIENILPDAVLVYCLHDVLILILVDDSEN